MTEHGASSGETAASPGVVYVMDVADRPGIMHAVAAVFAHRGLSMRALMADTGRKPSRILVVFRGTPRQCRLVERVLARLHDVRALRTVSEDSPELRAVALCHPLHALPALTGVAVQYDGATAIISGAHIAVERVLAELATTGAVDEVSRALTIL